jgi:hypothetical protein
VSEWESPWQLRLRNGERRELKHLSTGRKRKQFAMSSVTASEGDAVQTEAPSGGYVVFGLAISTGRSDRSLLERSARQGDSPVDRVSTV